MRTALVLHVGRVAIGSIGRERRRSRARRSTSSSACATLPSCGARFTVSPDAADALGCAGLDLRAEVERGEGGIGDEGEAAWRAVSLPALGNR